MDAWAGLREGFEQELGSLLAENPTLRDLVEAIGPDAGVEQGKAGARAAVAPLLWGSRVGERWDVQRTTEFLGVSRQALYKRVKNGSLLGVRGHGTTWFPTWQFDHTTEIVRAVVASILDAFRAGDPDIDPLVVAAWATKSTGLLDGLSPAEWVAQGRGDDVVVLAARRAAAALGA